METHKNFDPEVKYNQTANSESGISFFNSGSKLLPVEARMGCGGGSGGGGGG